MTTNKRIANRKMISGVSVSNVTALSHFAVISKIGLLIDASSTGLLLHLDRKDLIPKNLRESLSLDQLIGERLMVRIKEMNLDIDGIVSRSRHVGKGIFEVGIDFSMEAPEYWRECLVDLLPSEGEISEN